MSAAMALKNRHNLCIKRIRSGESDCSNSCPLYQLRKGHNTCSEAVGANADEAERILREHGQWEKEWL